jgi:hypothetical protein
MRAFYDAIAELSGDPAIGLKLGAAASVNHAGRRIV